MPDSTSTGPERRTQFWFILRTLAGCALLPWAIQQYLHWEWTIPDRVELGRKTAALIAEPVRLPAAAPGAVRVAGAWEMSSDDRRFGGISGLAADGNQLIAITDSGSVIRFAPPGGAGRRSLEAEIFELPDGPMSGDFKRNRDAEALAADPAGRGWWVAFENHDSLWLFERDFTRSLMQTRLTGIASGWNKGVEAIAAVRGGLLLLPEAGRSVAGLGRGPAGARAIANARGRISDAAVLPSGRVLVLERNLEWRGFSARISELGRTAGGYALGLPAAVPGGWLDNYEAMAVDRSGKRLWLMTDDNFDGRFRTLLVAVAIPDA